MNNVSDKGYTTSKSGNEKGSVLMNFQSPFKYQLFLFVIPVFSFAVAFAWNDAVQTIFRTLLPRNQTELIHIKIAYAIIITIIAVIILFVLYRFLGI